MKQKDVYLNMEDYKKMEFTQNVSVPYIINFFFPIFTVIFTSKFNLILMYM